MLMELDMLYAVVDTDVIEQDPST